MSKLRKEGYNGHFRICLNENNAKNEQCRLFKGEVAGAETGSSSSWVFLSFFLQRERLLSSFSADSTVGSLRDKKESCSTRSGLRVDTRFEEF